MKKYFSISALALLSVLCFSTTFSSCNKDKDENPGGLIVGTWRSVANPSCREVYTFSSDGTGFYSKECKTDISSFTWFVIDDVLTIVWDNNNKVERFTFDVNNGKIYLYDKDGDVYIYTKIKTSDEDKDSKSKDLVGTWRDADDGDEECASLLTFYSNGKGLDWFACDGEMGDESIAFTWSVNGNILSMDDDGVFRFEVKGNKLYLYDTEYEDDYFVFEKVK